MITKEQLLQIRLKSSKPARLGRLDELEMKLRIVELSSAATDALGKVKTEKQGVADSSIFMFCNALAHENGELLTAVEAKELISALSIHELNVVLTDINALNTEGLEQGKQTGSPAPAPATTETSSIVSAESSAAPTPISSN